MYIALPFPHTSPPLPYSVLSPGWFPELDVLCLSSSTRQAPFQVCVWSSTPPQIYLNVCRAQLGSDHCSLVSCVRKCSASLFGFIWWTLSPVSEETVNNVLQLLPPFRFFATCSWSHHFPRLKNHNLPSPLFFPVVSSEPFTCQDKGTRLNCAQGLEKVWIYSAI